MNEKIVLPESIKRKCMRLLPQCPQFANKEYLRDVFHIKGLYEYKNQIPDSHKSKELAEWVITQCCESGWYQSGNPYILLFLRQLFPMDPPKPGDGGSDEQRQKYERYQELERLYIDLDLLCCQKFHQHNTSGPEASLKPTEVAFIASNLLLCPSISDEEIRQKLYREFNLNIQPTDVPVIDVLAMLHAWPASVEIKALIQFIGKYDGGSEHFGNLYYARFYAVSELNYEHVRELQEIIEWMDCPKYVWLDVCKRQNPTQANTLSDSLFATLMSMTFLPSPLYDSNLLGMHPLLNAAQKFVQYAKFSTQIDSLIIAALENWIQDRTRALRVDLQQEPDAKNAVKKETLLDQYYLRVILHPSGSLFNVEARFLDKNHQLVVGDDVPGCFEEEKSLEEIEGVMNNLLDKCEIYFGKLIDKEIEVGNLTTIEFVVPHILLSHPFDQCYQHQNTPDSEKASKGWRIGIAYNVVLCSWKRVINRPRYLHLWRQRWKQYKEIEETVERMLDDNDVRFCRKGENFSESLMARPKACSAVMDFDPQYSEVSTFEDMLATGIPIALWSRKDWSGTDLMKDECFFPSTSGKLVYLREAIKHYRREHFNDEKHPGNHLTLMWDDPEIKGDYMATSPK